MGIGEEPGTRERILEATEEVLGERGYYGTRLHEIARRVGIHKASLFHYFSTKQELYRAVLDRSIGETEILVRRILESDVSPPETIRRLIEAYVDLVVAHPHRTKVILRQSLGDAPSDAMMPNMGSALGLVEEYIVNAQRVKIFRPVEARRIILDVVGMVAFAFTSASVVAPEWCRDPFDADGVERLKRHVVDVALRYLSDPQAASVAPNRRLSRVSQ